MANSYYPKGKEGFLRGEIAWQSDVIRVVLIDTQKYQFNPQHKFLSSIPSNARIAISEPLENKTTTDAVADADDAFFQQPNGSTCRAVVIFADYGDDSSSRLICYLDSGIGFPLLFNGNDLVLVWSNGENKIFRL